MWQKIVLEWSCKILSGFQKTLIANMIAKGLQSGYHASKLHICKLMSYFMFSYNPELNVMFVLL